MILAKDIIKEGDERLKQKASIVNPITDDDIKLACEMLEYVRNSVDEEIATKYGLQPSVGIAAPQLGILKRIVAISAYDEEGNLHEYALINPKILSYSADLTYLKSGEGCLSVERCVRGYVFRHRKITFSAIDVKDGTLNQIKVRLKGYLAVVFQHEYDHLEGFLFPERINKENPFMVPENATPIIFEEDEENDNQETNA